MVALPLFFIRRDLVNSFSLIVRRFNYITLLNVNLGHNRSRKRLLIIAHDFNEFFHKSQVGNGLLECRQCRSNKDFNQGPLVNFVEVGLGNANA